MIPVAEACIAHQTIVDSKVPAGPIGKGQRVRLWKIEDRDEFQKWSEEDALRNRLGKVVVDDKIDEDEEGEGDLEAEPAVKSARKSNRIYFLKQDLSDSSDSGSLGSVRVGALVDFDLCIDKLNGTRVAANVRVSDDAVSNGQWPQVGVVEYVREGEGPGAAGYIRSIPNDEKLPWINSQQPLVLGSIVCYEIRNRGGVRYANRVTLLDATADNTSMLEELREKTLPGCCIGVITASHDPADASCPFKYFLHPLDFTSCPEIAKKFIDIPGSIVKVHEKKRLATAKSEASSWEKVNPEEETKTSKNTQQAAPIKPQATIDGVPIFYPPLAMSPIPLDQSIYSSLCVPGTIVEFKPIVNWCVTRGLHGITDVVKREEAVNDVLKSTSSSAVAAESKGGATPLALLSRSLEVEADTVSPVGRVKGTIIRLTINVGGGMELAEISRRDGTLFYCESKELRFVSSGNVHVGDEVEFLPASYFVKRPSSEDGSEELGHEMRVAVGPVLIAQSKVMRKKPTATLSTSRPAETAPPKPVFKNPITMAQVLFLHPSHRPLTSPHSIVGTPQ